MRGPAPRAAFALALACGVGAGPARGADGDAQPAAAWFPRGLVELKRQATARGTPDETTRTQVKFDLFPQHAIVALLRLELPFPDAKTDFSGSPFDPDFGDAKVRVGLRAVDIAGRPTTSFLELTFPTADPPSQGSGKYQWSAGAKMAFALAAAPAWMGAPRQGFSVQVQQVGSFAGDRARKDISQTKFELEWRDTWPGGHYGKATAKPLIDWVGSGHTGAVLEIEGGWVIDRHWTLALMGGGLLWGEGVPGTYSKRLELKLAYRY